MAGKRALASAPLRNSERRCGAWYPHHRASRDRGGTATPAATIFSLAEHPEAASQAATWFSSKWGIPAEAYRESIEAARHGLDRLYLVTDRDRFYERCGWEYLGDVRDDGGAPLRPYGADTLPPAGDR